MLRTQIKFRLKFFSGHLLASALVLGTVVGGMYVGWYRWPGWYLADATQATRVMIGVDLVVGPLLTLVVANAAKPFRVLARDISVIAVVQLIALGYGSYFLWNGRPLYYAFSEDVLQLVQAYDISATQAALGRQKNPELAPHWYSLPRWIWAPLPEGEEGAKIVQAAISGGDDVISLPSRYEPWADAQATLRSQLKKLDDIKYFSGNEKKILRQRMQDQGLSADLANAIALTGRSRPLLVVLDPSTLTTRAILRTD